MLKKLLAFAIAAVFLLTVFPASYAAASYPSVKPGKSTAYAGETVSFSIVTSNQIVKLQTLLDGKKGSTYTKYTEKKGLRYWSASIYFEKGGKRKVQYYAYKKSGKKTLIPAKPVYVNIKTVNTYKYQVPSSPVLTGKKAEFTVVTPATVDSLRYYTDGKVSSKTVKFKESANGLKTWVLSMTFLTPGTRKLQFAAYSKKGSLMKKFPSKAFKVPVKDGAPQIDAFKISDKDVVPAVEGSPKFTLDAYNQSNITVQIFNSAGGLAGTLFSNRKTVGETTLQWNIVDKNKNLTVPADNYTAKMHAANSGGSKDISIDFAVKPLETPKVTTENAFVVDYDIVSMKGNIGDDGNVAITEAGFCYGASPDILDKKVSCGKVYEGDGYRSLLSKLSAGTTYYFQAYAVNKGGKKGTGSVVAFTTPAKGSWTVEDSFKKSVDEEYKYIFNSTNKKYTISSPPVGYGSSAEAALYIKTVTVPVWKITNGNYVQSTLTVRVHRKLVAPVKAIFAEILALPNKFPIKTLSSFYYRTIKGPNASSTLSFHSYGCAIDINASDNPHVKSGDPRKATNPYRVPQEVVNIFQKYGWDWGGYFTTSKDYMHFEYLGTPLGKIVPPSPEPSPSPSPSPSESPSPSPSESPAPSDAPIEGD
jgi:hypothetical protein